MSEPIEPVRSGTPGAVPRPYRAIGVVRETADVTTILLEPVGGDPCLRFHAGQFAELGLDGGPISAPLVSDPGTDDHVAVTVWAPSEPARHRMDAVDIGHPVTVAGPHGTPWPLDHLGGRPLAVIAVGAGVSLVRSLLLTAGRGPRRTPIRLLIAVERPEDLLYRGELDRWGALGIRTRVTVGRPPEAWGGWTGLSEDSTVMVAGPPEAVHRVADVLRETRPACPVWTRSLPDARVAALATGPPCW